MFLRILYLFSFFLASCSEKAVLWDASKGSLQKPNIDISICTKSHKGFVLGMEPFLTNETYISEDSFFFVLNSYFNLARSQEVLPVERSVVVLPEHIGSLLVLSGEDASVFLKNSINDAFEVVRDKNFVRFSWVYLMERNNSQARLHESVFRMKAFQMVESYQNVFSRLAKDYRVDIIAGSIILPEPKVVEGKITVSDGPLQNVSFYFHSDGTVDDQITRKNHLDELEKLVLTSVPSLHRPTYKTPFGILSICISADSLHSDSYQTIVENETKIFAIPGSVSSSKDWEKKWKNFNLSDMPIDVGKSDLERFNLKQGWLKYSLAGRAKKYELKYGLSIFFRGKVWDIDTHGDAFLLQNGKSIFVNKKLAKGTGRVQAIGI